MGPLRVLEFPTRASARHGVPVADGPAAASFGASVGRRLPPCALAEVAAGYGMSGGVLVTSGRRSGRCR